MIFTLSLFYIYIVCKKIFFIVALPQVIYNVYPYNMVKYLCLLFIYFLLYNIHDDFLGRFRVSNLSEVVCSSPWVLIIKSL